MIVFADSSALVTRYAEESDRRSLGRRETLVVSQLARVEVPSAIWRKQRMGELSAADAAILTAAFEADYAGTAVAPGYAVVLATPAILEVAARYIPVYGLRAYDAVQLASATAVMSVVPECRTFAAYDRTLRAAAAAESFVLFPVEVESPGSGR